MYVVSNSRRKVKYFIRYDKQTLHKELNILHIFNNYPFVFCLSDARIEYCTVVVVNYTVAVVYCHDVIYFYCVGAVTIHMLG